MSTTYYRKKDEVQGFQLDSQSQLPSAPPSSQFIIVPRGGQRLASQMDSTQNAPSCPTQSVQYLPVKHEINLLDLNDELNPDPYSGERSETPH